MAEPTKRPIHVALTIDDGFWAPAYATMRSICLTTHRRADLVYHLCHTGLRPDHREQLDRIQDEFGSAVRYYDVRTLPEYGATATRMKYVPRLTTVAYARLFLDRLLDAHIERVIYIDCDFLVLAPIEELYSADLAGRPLGAVKSERSLLLSNGRDFRMRHELFDPADPHFNCGIMVIDMAGWRAADVVGTVNAVLEEGKYTGVFACQPYLNLAFRRNWTQLDWRWNVYATPKRSVEPLHPKGVHYVGPRKPWHLGARLPHALTYRYAMTEELFRRYRRERWRRKLLGAVSRR